MFVEKKWVSVCVCVGGGGGGGKGFFFFFFLVDRQQVFLRFSSYTTSIWNEKQKNR